MTDPGRPIELPTNGKDQSCSFCGGADVRWVHPLDQGAVRYRLFGKGHTLPHFWTVCDRCERLHRSGDEDALVEVMVDSDQWPGTTLVDVDEQVRQPLAVFRRADLGARRLGR